MSLLKSNSILIRKTIELKLCAYIVDNLEEMRVGYI